MSLNLDYLSRVDCISFYVRYASSDIAPHLYDLCMIVSPSLRYNNDIFLPSTVLRDRL
jgi:hypothetical protein